MKSDEQLYQNLAAAYSEMLVHLVSCIDLGPYEESPKQVDLLNMQGVSRSVGRAYVIVNELNERGLIDQKHLLMEMEKTRLEMKKEV